MLRRLMMTGGSGMTDPYFANRVTIANLTDDLSDPKRTWTAANGAAVSGGWLQLNGTNQYIETPTSSDFDFGSGDFCLEAYVNASTFSGSERAIMCSWGASGYNWFFGTNTSGQIVFVYYTAGGSLLFPAFGSISLNTDTHVALFNLSGTMHCAINGAVVATTGVASVRGLSQVVRIGATADNNGYFGGKIRGARITKGSTGGYTLAGFTPPTMPLPDGSGGPSVTYRSRLQFAGADASTTFTDDTGKVWTAGGNAQIDTSLGDQRALFDGTGDYITTPHHADLVFSGDFKISFTMRFNNKAGYQTIAGKGYTPQAASSWLVQTGNGDGKLNFYYLSAGSGGVNLVASDAGSTVNNGQDYDIEISRVGSTVTIKRDGVTVGTGTSSFSYVSTSDLVIGGGSNTGFNNYWFNGWIKDFRIT